MNTYKKRRTSRAYPSPVGDALAFGNGFAVSEAPPKEARHPLRNRPEGWGEVKQEL